MTDGKDEALAIVGALKRAGITVAASLPDSWLAPVIAAIDADPAIKHVRVTREDDGAGICAGASLGGAGAVLVCQNAGLLLSTNVLAGYAMHHQLPFLILAVLRGSREDRFYYQMYKGAVTEPVLQAIGLPYSVMESAADTHLIEDAVWQARLMRSPAVVLLRKSALMGGAGGSR